MNRVVVFSVVLGSVGCASADFIDRSEADVASSEWNPAPEDPCRARLSFLQKDAYKETAGRSSVYWPPHTTTVLEVTCQTELGERTIAPFQSNYGTEPGARDANGDVILVPVSTDEALTTVEAPWSKMKDLVASYRECGCDPSKFLSLDTLNEEVTPIVDELLGIAECPDSREAIELAIQEKRLRDAGAMLARCRVREDVGAPEIQDAITASSNELRETYETHHVCNNNAMLQNDLFARFRTTSNADSCIAHRATFCAGPKVWYDPTTEVK